MLCFKGLILEILPSVEVLVSTTLDILHVAHAPRYPGSQVVDHASRGYPWSNQVYFVPHDGLKFPAVDWIVNWSIYASLQTTHSAKNKKYPRIQHISNTNMKITYPQRFGGVTKITSQQYFTDPIILGSPSRRSGSQGWWWLNAGFQWMKPQVGLNMKISWNHHE